MTGMQLRKAREQKGWNQQQASARLGVSQPYLSLLERSHRRLTPRLVARATGVFNLPLTSLPLKTVGSQTQTLQQVAEELSALGYPGFAYMRTRKRRNPAEALVAALKQENLEARLAEALPWVLPQLPEPCLEMASGPSSTTQSSESTGLLGFHGPNEARGKGRIAEPSL